MTNQYFKSQGQDGEINHLAYEQSEGFVVVISPKHPMQGEGVIIDILAGVPGHYVECGQEEWDNTLFSKWNFDVRTTVALNSRAFTPVTKVSTGHNTAVAA